ncbi:MAG: hypothetical protein Q9174_002286 [Haloplaca sp. 1 TL-2023]
MSLLWKAFFEDDVDQFTSVSLSSTLTRTELNLKDSSGCTLLHHIASSTNENAYGFAAALLDLPLLDLYIQDAENGWTALHRALYFGNVSIARALLHRDYQNAIGQSNAGISHNALGLIKIKDREGNSPFDLYGASIASREIGHEKGASLLPGYADIDDDAESESSQAISHVPPAVCTKGDELWMFGTNKNFNLGFGDSDDRQYPERIHLKRPHRLLNRLAEECSNAASPAISLSGTQEMHDTVPALIRSRRLLIQDVRLAKFHSAILTTDPEANLYVAGHGPGGRLGTGDENTRFHFIPVLGGGLAGRKIADVGLGQDHTVAVTSQGEVFTWGTNAFGQLGQVQASASLVDEPPKQLLPKQLFGPLKRERVLGTAASLVHSVVYTSSSLYTFGKNDGQLGLVDSDARSLATQSIPRRVAASLFTSSISAVSAIEKATICLLENHDVWVLANWGYAKITFPLDGSQSFVKNHFLATRYNAVPHHIRKVASGGDTIYALSNEGDLFSVNLSDKGDSAPVSTSTTNPSKIRGALSTPQRIWSPRKSQMIVRDLDVGQDGSIIICTDAGVWRRVKRIKVRDANAPISADHKQTFKFSRIPGLTKVSAVRSNTYGAYAAIRNDCNVMQTQVNADPKSLWQDFYPLSPVSDFPVEEEDSETENPRLRFWAPSVPRNSVAAITQTVCQMDDAEIAQVFHDKNQSQEVDCHIGTTRSKVYLPIHECILSARSPPLKRAISAFRTEYFFAMPGVLQIEYDAEGKVLILFQDLDFLTVFNFALYIYTDTLAEFWLQTGRPTAVISRYRLIRTELLKIGSHLQMRHLEQSVRVQSQPPKTLDEDMQQAVLDKEYFAYGDVKIQLSDGSLNGHSPILCQRSPFFAALFEGRAAGRWLSGRRQQSQESIKVNLTHIDMKTFELVRAFIYADQGEVLFDQVYCQDLDTFLDFVIAVLAAADELMLDRLSQCCQVVLGQHVNMRNVCQLLNSVASCSITIFKEAALEYICLNLEGMLEHHLLDELDIDLIPELDNTVRENQLACLPISRSGRAEAELVSTYPQLIEEIQNGKRTKIDQIAFQCRRRRDDPSFRSGTIDDEDKLKPLLQRQTRKASYEKSSATATKPALNAKRSTTQLMFEMDPVESLVPHSPKPPTRTGFDTAESVQFEDYSAPSSLAPESPWLDAKKKQLGADIASSTSPFGIGEARIQSSLDALSSPEGQREPNKSSPWQSHTPGSQKLETIMAQASSDRVSNITKGFATPAPRIDPTSSTKTSRLSQRERKQQQQREMLQESQEKVVSPHVEPEVEARRQVSPWHVASSSGKTSLKDIFVAETKAPTPKRQGQDRHMSNPSLTLRQTVPGKPPAATCRTASEGSSQSNQKATQRSTSSPSVAHAAATPPRPTSSRTMTTPVAIGPSSSTPTRSIRYTTNPSHSPAEASLQLSMADILSQQQTEKDNIREAVAKRSLQEIQEEQAFQEWWDEESRKVREEEQEASKATIAKSPGDGKRGGSRVRGRGNARGKGRRAAGHGEVEGEASAASHDRTGSSRDGANGARVRGKGRGRGRGNGPST